jgi:cytochrome c biogenesis protein CcmG/thiol:disulfide interchange protein DsbE
MALSLSRCTGEKKQPAGVAPDFTLKTLDNEELSLSGLRGKVVLLDFWATWCGPCRESIPHLVQLQKNYQEKGFQVIGLSVDKGDGSAVRNFVKSMGIPYPVVMTPEDVARNYGVSSLPTTFLIDKEGKIRDKMIGFSSAVASQMAARIEELTSEKAP